MDRQQVLPSPEPLDRLQVGLGQGNQLDRRNRLLADDHVQSLVVLFQTRQATDDDDRDAGKESPQPVHDIDSRGALQEMIADYQAKVLGRSAQDFDGGIHRGGDIDNKARLTKNCFS